ncbi:2257_t:CDS:2 [Ambispora gerdemannii]|uniref:2257_t:CDS:1 n=1 Tax=Ambispora gerdemannii TaxID=144530 RepID=A0A9N8ZYN3_9GLOM|nr:2257_t:CDS:2 [Ambispora gerdemannii]
MTASGFFRLFVIPRLPDKGALPRRCTAPGIKKYYPEVLKARKVKGKNEETKSAAKQPLQFYFKKEV